MSKQVLKIAIILGLLTSVLMAPLSIHAQLAAPDTTELETVRCWRHVLEPDDVLMIARYNIHYGNTSAQPYQPINETFDFTYTLGNSTLAGNTTAYPFFNLGYSRGLVAFYWGGNETLTPPWADTGNVTMTGTGLFGGGPPTDTFTLTSSNWVTPTDPASIREDLRQWLINALLFVELDWNNWYADQGFDDSQADLLMTVEGSYIVASPGGATYLRYAIEDIETIVPLLFMFQLTQPSHTERDHDLTQQTTIENQHEGDALGNATAIASDLLGGVGRIWASTLIVLVGCFGIIIVCQTAWGKMNCGMLIAYVLILLATPEGLFQMGLMALFACLAVLQIAYTLFWRRSAG